ncbi:MAG TPA: hypothetical protein ENK91_12260 [Bacteroidetes bacterium]|nr:hypothetical protein [Bacteroidota bacterium]
MKKILLLFVFVLSFMTSYANATAGTTATKSIELTEKMLLGKNDISDGIIYLGRYDVYVDGKYVGTYDVYLITP